MTTPLILARAIIMAPVHHTLWTRPVHHMSDVMPNPFVAIASTVGVVSGLGSALVAQVADGEAGTAVSVGLWVSVASIFSALFGCCIQFAKMWFEDRKSAREFHAAEEKAKWERHDLANKLHLAELKIASQAHDLERQTHDLERQTQELEILRQQHGSAINRANVAIASVAQQTGVVPVVKVDLEADAKEHPRPGPAED